MIAMTCKFAPKATGKTAAAPKKAAVGDPVIGFTLQDDQSDIVTVSGVDKAGVPVDISAVATIAVTSDNPAVLTVASPVGMTFEEDAVAPGTANVTVTATWNDGSIGPFTISYPDTVTGGTATGLSISHGVPTVK